MLSNRMFSIHLEEMQSKLRRLNNGLPQDSVLVPILFKIYKFYIPPTASCKFIYADDITLATQHNKFEVTEEILTNYLKLTLDYLHKWRIIPNIADKTVVTTFHLNNRM